MTIREVIQKSAEFLERHGVDSPRLQAEHLLGHVLKLPRLQLYLQFDRVLNDAELGALRELIKRRGAREPLQHLMGTAVFCGLELKVCRHVLVPRPETELLAERVLEDLATRFPLTPALSPNGGEGARRAGEGETSDEPPRVLDLGTGTGCLAITFAKSRPDARVWAVDVSADALAVARENAVRHNMTERIEFLLGDCFAPLPAEAAFDLIVSNPPYIPSAEIQTLQPEVRDFDPHAALDGGADGLDLYRRLAADAPRFLRPGGKLMAEFGDGQAPTLEKLFSEHKWIVEAVVDDYSRRPRILIARPA